MGRPTKIRQHWWCPHCKYVYPSPVALQVAPVHECNPLALKSPQYVMKMVGEDDGQETDTE